jgi:predicted methyltransferase
MKRALTVVFALAALSSCSRPPPENAQNASASAAETDQRIRAALAGNHRPKDERARDVYRHPLETLDLFGLRDDMTVLELWPGGGWYTAVLAPVLAEKGKLVATNFDPNGDPKSYTSRVAKKYLKRLAERPDVYGKVAIRTVDPDAALDFGAPESIDMAVTFRSIHNWLDDGMADKVFAATFRVLKPGGVLGVEEHRANQDTPEELLKNKGYVPQAYVIELAEKAGFVLVATSEVNANPKDTKDYDEGVWALPPTFAYKDKDHDKYAAIGESDRMTLKFVKPAR